MGKKIPKHLAKIRKQWIVEKWEAEKSDLSMNELALIFNCSASFVFNAIKKYQLKKENK